MLQRRRERRRQVQRWLSWVALGLGTVLSVGRVMQGAHFFSHNLWTLLFDWTICLACYRLVLYRAVPAMPPLLAEQPAR